MCSYLIYSIKAYVSNIKKVDVTFKELAYTQQPNVFKIITGKRTLSQTKLLRDYDK